jgi:hypothetical protein
MAAVLPNMTHRQVLQRLLSGEWKTLTQLGVMAGDGLLERLKKHGWIERRVVGRTHEIKITPAGVEALRARIPNNPLSSRHPG